MLFIKKYIYSFLLSFLLSFPFMIMFELFQYYDHSDNYILFYIIELMITVPMFLILLKSFSFIHFKNYLNNKKLITIKNLIFVLYTYGFFALVYVSEEIISTAIDYFKYKTSFTFYALSDLPYQTQDLFNDYTNPINFVEYLLFVVWTLMIIIFLIYKNKEYKKSRKKQC